MGPKTGRVRIKVSPGEGNHIRSALVTGCIHVYGTSDLSEKMRYISGTAFDLTPYLRSDTKGEADLTVSLGSYTFIKVKAESIGVCGGAAAGEGGRPVEQLADYRRRIWSRQYEDDAEGDGRRSRDGLRR